MRRKMNLIALGVDDFNRSLNFYEKGLGWNKSEKSMDDLALLPLGGMILALYPRQALADDAMVKNTREIPEKYAFEIGETDGSCPGRIVKVREILSVAGGCRVVDNLLSIRWSKLIVNATFCGMTAALYGEQESNHGFFQQTARNE